MNIDGLVRKISLRLVEHISNKSTSKFDQISNLIELP